MATTSLIKMQFSILFGLSLIWMNSLDLAVADSTPTVTTENTTVVATNEGGTIQLHSATTDEFVIATADPTPATESSTVVATDDGATTQSHSATTDEPVIATSEPKLRHMTVTMSSDVAKLLREKPADFIYVKLNFTNVTFESDTAYLNQTPTVIDPYTWTYAAGRIGNFIRSFPPNFYYLSFGTFDHDVDKIVLNVEIHRPDEFRRQNDYAKLQRLSESLVGVFMELNLSDFKVCQEFYDDTKHTATAWAWIVSLNVYMYQHTSIQVKCWSSTDLIHRVGRVEPQIEESYWLTILYYTVVVLGAFYFPKFLFKIVICKDPPIYDKVLQEYRMHINTYLPLGLSYYMFTLGNEYPIIIILRIALGLAGLVALAHLEDLILLITDDRYQVRLNSAYRSVVDKDQYRFDTFVIFFPMLLLAIIFIDQLVLQKNRSRTFCLENSNDRKTIFITPSADDKKEYIKKSRTDMPWGNQFYYYMKCRMHMAFDGKFVWDLESGLESRPRSFPVKLITLIPFSLFLYIRYSPCVYILSWFWIPNIIGRKKFEDYKKYKKWPIYITASGLCLIGFLLYIRLTIRMASLLGNLVEYTFSGFLLNVHNPSPTFFIFLSVLSYTLTTVRGFYESYHKLFVKVLESAVAHCDTDNKSSSPTIPLTLFWSAVNKCKPIEIEIVFRILRLLFMTCITLACFDILSRVGSLQTLTNSTHTLVSFAITILFPILDKSLESKGVQNKVIKVIDEYKKDNPEEEITKDLDHINEETPEETPYNEHLNEMTPDNEELDTGGRIAFKELFIAKP